MRKYYRPDVQDQRLKALEKIYGFCSAPNYVYTIVERRGRNRNPIYVGETCSPKSRFIKHLKVAYNGREDHSLLGRLERQAIAQGNQLEMHCLEACQNRIVALSKEAAWARALRGHGYKLANSWAEHLPASNVSEVPVKRIKRLTLREILALKIKLTVICKNCCMQVELPNDRLRQLKIGNPSLVAIETKLICTVCSNKYVFKLSFPQSVEAMRIIKFDSVEVNEFISFLESK